MAIELKLSRSSPDVSWGFRIVGGADFNEPLIVVKVNDDSLAEQAGLQVGDLLVRINDTSTAGLTHTEAHDLLVATGTSFVLGVRRGEMPTQIFHDENYNIDYSNKPNQFEVPADGEDFDETLEMRRAIQSSVEKNILEEAVERINMMTNKPEDMKDLPSLLSENLSGQEEIVYTSTQESKKSITHGIKTDKKWSTFLMKPDMPIPKPKKQIEEEKVKGEGYKVVIQKQPSRRKRAQMLEKKVHFDENVVETKDEELKVEEDEEFTKIEYKRNIEYDVDINVTEEETGEFGEYAEESVDSENDADDEVEADSDNNKEPTEIHYPPLSQIRVDSESTLTLEEQLRSVQKQLEALAHLPSAIQLTLDAVSKQLASIVSARNSQEKEEENTGLDDNGNEEERNDGDSAEEMSTSEVAEAEQNGEDIADTNSNLGEELEEDDIAEEELKAILERNESLEVEPEPDEGLKEEERLAQLREEELIEKKKKGMAERQEYLAPIVLPGGRRWSEPDDAVPIFKKPKKVPEEKMFELIENNLETISGKRKGINFKKFQPPAKNMAYLQHSEVYRMIHEMDRPTRGIGNRAEKIPAVQDYYEAIKGTP